LELARNGQFPMVLTSIRGREYHDFVMGGRDFKLQGGNIETMRKTKFLLPASYCLCSVGWVLEMFEIVAQKPVRVDLVQSVKRGASSCKFLVRL